MALDFVQYINANVTVLTTEQKIAMLNDFCEARGYKEKYVKDEKGNDTSELVQTKKEFFNQDLINYVKILVNGERDKRAKKEIVIDSLVLE